MLRILPVLAILASAAEKENLMNGVAESYVKLVLTLGEHDANYVDAYYGPEEWKTAAARAKEPLNEIRTKAAAARKELAAVEARKLPEIRRSGCGTWISNLTRSSRGQTCCEA